MNFKKNLKKKFQNIFSTRESSFITWFSVFFLGTLVLLAVFGLLPSELQEESNGTSFIQSAEQSAQSALGILNSAGKTGGQNTQTAELQNSSGVQGSNGAQRTQALVPDRLVIPAISVNTVIRNPESSDINDLDYELTKGAVRYPGSGTIGNGNMFIFGHSTGFKVVINKAYKVFNELHTLTKGDEILLQSGTKTFVYTVTTVEKVNKNSTEIQFDTKSNMLTLSTCDSFGAKSDRYIVEAQFVGTR